MSDASDKLSTAQLVIVGSGALALLGSFLPWIDLDIGLVDATQNAWDDFLFPTYTWPAILGAAMATVVLVTTFSTTALPSQIGGFTVRQLFRVGGLFAVIVTVSFLVAGEQHGIGFWLSLLASVGLLVGSVMLEREPAPGGHAAV